MTNQNRNSKRKLFLGVFVVVLVIGVMVFSAIGTSIWGVELHGIEQDIAKVEAENRRLTSEIVKQTSLTDIYENADDLGYTSPENVVYAQDEKSVASIN